MKSLIITVADVESWLGPMHAILQHDRTCAHHGLLLFVPNIISDAAGRAQEIWCTYVKAARAYSDNGYFRVFRVLGLYLWF